MDTQALLSSFTPDQIQVLKAAIDSLTDVSGRTSEFLPRQLHDLRIPASATDARPTFFWSAASPTRVDTSQTKPYPRLMWDAKTGREVTVSDAAGQATYTAKGFVLMAPSNAEKPPMESLRDLLTGLSDKDRQLVLNGAQAARMEQIKASVLDLSDEERAALVAEFAAMEPDKAKRAS